MINKPVDAGIILKTEQAKIRKEFEYLNTTKYIQSDFVSAQSKEICKYLNRMALMPFPAWEAFIRRSITVDKEDFLYRFYLKENEYNLIEPDEDRITELKLQDLKTV